MSEMIVSKGPELSKEQARLLKSALQYNVELFRGGEEIWPDQCDYALSRLEAVQSIVQDYCNLFTNDICFSGSKTAGQPDSGFLVTLHYTSKQLSELQTLVAAFQPVCRSAAKHIKKRRAEILSKLELFLLNSEDILKGIALPDKEPSYYRYQRQHIAASKSDHTPDVKRRPPHLIPVRANYVEERDAPKLTLASEEHAVPLNEQSKQTDTPMQIINAATQKRGNLK